MRGSGAGDGVEPLIWEQPPELAGHALCGYIPVSVITLPTNVIVLQAAHILYNSYCGG